MTKIQRRDLMKGVAATAVNARPAPRESATHTFSTRGEYFFNDPSGPRSTGKIEVY
ncbi:hypothetical protein [Amycolatopsis sp. NPDC051061]|uniref:hypothetical protein n=1 Tax=Amycolatopsis sp. NPDC051061 TaxID=3155042 RepID=UPI0034126E3D